MNKKSLATFLLLAVVSAGLVSPAFAQSQQPSGNQNFFGIFTHFFSQMFGHNNQITGDTQGGQSENAAPSDMPIGTPSGMPSGQPDGQRLQGLVTAGKITQAQEQEILTEISKIRSEIQSWSSSTGVNADYIYGGLRGPMMNAGIGNAPSGVQPSGTQGVNSGQGGFHLGSMQGGHAQGGMQPQGHQ